MPHVSLRFHQVPLRHRVPLDAYAGYGLSGRVAQHCDQGYYNPGNNYDQCTACPFGTTTAGAGTGRTLADCATGLGYGQTDGKMGLCPIGAYIEHMSQASRHTPWCSTILLPAELELTCHHANNCLITS